MKYFITRVKFHARIFWALLLRELATRYGRDNIGFLWIIGEPLLFCFGVLIMWSLIRPPYDHGIAVVPFIVTGYLPLTLIRHTINQGVHCVKVNSNLLYHRQITILHLFLSRISLEIIGCSLASLLVVIILKLIGLEELPPSIPIIYVGWFLLAWIVFGMTLIFGSIAALSETFERAVNLLTYVMIPLSGAFYMVAWLPYQYRAMVERVPLVDCVEMIRNGFFGEFYPTYYNIGYTAAWGLGFTFIGLVLVGLIRSRVEIE